EAGDLLPAAGAFCARSAREKDPALTVAPQPARASPRGGVIQARLGQHDAARKAFARAIARGEQLVADSPADPANRHDLANSLNWLGIVLRQPGEHEPAAEQYRHALNLQTQLASDYPTEPDYQTP